MTQQIHYLTRLVEQRIRAGGWDSVELLDKSSEVIVFGSVAAGLERADSDIDVFCFGAAEFTAKSDLLDLIILPHEMRWTDRWLRSELASHISQYGVWIKGEPVWVDRARIGREALIRKRRRVESFMRSLPRAWNALDGSFKVKYSIKVRREMQRLLLLTQSVPIPPTIILDTAWQESRYYRSELQRTLRRFVPNGSDTFVDSLYQLMEGATTCDAGFKRLRAASRRGPIARFERLGSVV
jgi:hypothetical protein